MLYQSANNTLILSLSLGAIATYSLHEVHVITSSFSTGTLRLIEEGTKTLVFRLLFNSVFYMLTSVKPSQ